MPPKDSASTGRIMLHSCAGDINAAFRFSRIGNQPSLYAKKYCSSDANTNDGTDTLITTIVEIALSASVFFLSAAMMPQAMPMGMVMMSEKIFSTSVIGIFSAMISKTGRRGYSVMDSPKSNERKLRRKIAYCSTSGLSR